MLLEICANLMIKKVHVKNFTIVMEVYSGFNWTLKLWVDSIEIEREGGEYFCAMCLIIINKRNKAS